MPVVSNTVPTFNISQSIKRNLQLKIQVEDLIKGHSTIEGSTYKNKYVYEFITYIYIIEYKNYNNRDILDTIVTNLTGSITMNEKCLILTKVP